VVVVGVAFHFTVNKPDIKKASEDEWYNAALYGSRHTYMSELSPIA